MPIVTFISALTLTPALSKVSLANWTKPTETSRISVIRDIADRFQGWQQLIANDIPLLTAVPFAMGP